jgi:RNA polymerase sigma-19 factor, ECF subfamily
MDKPLIAESLHEPKAFLTQVAHGLMVDQFRRRDIEQAYMQTLAYLPVQHIESAEEHLLNIEALMRIEAMFAGLHPHVRTTFLLSRLHGMTYPEIAKEMRVSLRSVENYMAKAIRQLMANANIASAG